MQHREDFTCPVCHGDVGKPTRSTAERCPHCDQLLVLVRVIGTDAVYLFYRRKK